MLATQTRLGAQDPLVDAMNLSLAGAANCCAAGNATATKRQSIPTCNLGLAQT